MLMFFLNRLKEPSTWKGMFLVAAAFGFVVPEQVGYAITVLGVALAGGVDMLPDKVVYPSFAKKSEVHAAITAESKKTKELVEDQCSTELPNSNSSVDDDEPSSQISQRIGESKNSPSSKSGFNDQQ
jgi:hypothetical protein